MHHNIFYLKHRLVGKCSQFTFVRYSRCRSWANAKLNFGLGDKELSSLFCTRWEVRRVWLEEDLRQPLHPSLGQRATSWQDLQQHDDSPVSPSIRRTSSYKDLVTRVGPSYGDLVERATPNCPFVSTILDCVLFLHNTLALTVYFLFVSESYERLGWIWPINRLGEPYTHIVTILWTASWGCFLSTLPTVGGLARLGKMMKEMERNLFFGQLFMIWIDMTEAIFGRLKEISWDLIRLFAGFSTRGIWTVSFVTDWPMRVPLCCGSWCNLIASGFAACRIMIHEHSAGRFHFLSGLRGSIWIEWLCNWHVQDEQTASVEAYTEDWFEKAPSVQLGLGCWFVARTNGIWYVYVYIYRGNCIMKKDFVIYTFWFAKPAMRLGTRPQLSL